MKSLSSPRALDPIQHSFPQTRRPLHTTAIRLVDHYRRLLYILMAVSTIFLSTCAFSLWDSLYFHCVWGGLAGFSSEWRKEDERQRTLAAPSATLYRSERDYNDPFETLLRGAIVKRTKYCTKKKGEYVGFCVYRRSHLPWSPVKIKIPSVTFSSGALWY